MAWAVEVSRTAEKQIAKLDSAERKRVVSFLRLRIATNDDPRRLGKALKGEQRGLWRYRVGDYRIICDIQDFRIVVLVLLVEHRKDVYR